jgi:hypothetical protein
MNSETAVKPVPGVIWRTLDDETVLILPNSGHYVIINEVGTFIWELIERAMPVKEIEREIVDNYGVTIEQAATDLQTFLNELSHKGLITGNPISV